MTGTISFRPRALHDPRASYFSEQQTSSQPISDRSSSDGFLITATLNEDRRRSIAIVIVDVEDIGAPVTEDHKDCDGGPLEDRGIISEMEDKRNQFRLTSWTYLLRSEGSGLGILPDSCRLIRREAGYLQDANDECAFKTGNEAKALFSSSVSFVAKSGFQNYGSGYGVCCVIVVYS
ncbi:hypothetical protein CAPTEDRAFT_207480 [Capitella teleta]|uniref:Uncharacterized protein n=1 Tax=Capitella teleta TaxID=283909 RepID=R7TT18_CAPTE|nr:hypothetical protein CAPTEDRAFT_207480 [Capitella teleta]|eukprot:ELT94636.1 hypothetical protein CAPTEDRAFT_207480 [Capitella teleta]